MAPHHSSQRTLSLVSNWSAAPGSGVAADNFRLRTKQASIDGETLQHAPWFAQLDCLPHQCILGLRIDDSMTLDRLQRGAPVYAPMASCEAELEQLLRDQLPLFAALFQRFDALAKGLIDARKQGKEARAKISHYRREAAATQAQLEETRRQRDARMSPADASSLALAYTKEKARAAEMTLAKDQAEEERKRLRAELISVRKSMRELDALLMSLASQLAEATRDRQSSAAMQLLMEELTSNLEKARKDAESACQRAERAESILQSLLPHGLHGSHSAAVGEAGSWALSQVFQRAIAEADAAAAASASREAEARRREVALASSLESVKAELRAADRARIAALETARAELRAAERERAVRESSGQGYGSATDAVARSAEARLKEMEHQLNLRALSQEHEEKRLQSEREAGEASLREAQLRAQVANFERERDAMVKEIAELKQTQQTSSQADAQTLAAIGMTQNIVHRAATEQALMRRERDRLLEVLLWLLARLRERSLGALAAEASARAGVQRAIGKKAATVEGARAVSAVSRAALSRARYGLSTVATELSHALPPQSIGG